MAGEQKPRGKPLDPKVKERIAWFIGMTATQEETAGACDVHRSTVAKVMSDPAYRKMADDILRSRTSMRAEVRAVFQNALNAFDSDGNPAYAVRQRAAEALAKNPELLAADADEGDDIEMLPGVVLLFPVQDEELPAPHAPGDEPKMGRGAVFPQESNHPDGGDGQRELFTLDNAVQFTAEDFAS